MKWRYSNGTGPWAAAALVILACSGCALKVKNVKPDQPYDFNVLDRLARYAQAAYQDDAAIRALCRPDFNDVYIRLIPETNNKYFIATSTVAKVHLIVVAGTANIENVLLDADFSQGYSLELKIPLHRGFSRAAQRVYDDVKTRLRPGYRIQITGHSLGGAEALILGMLLQVAGLPAERIVTFGQPKVTNPSGVDAFKGLPLLRVVNQNDVIPELPLDPYRHIGPELVLFPGTTYSLVDHRPLDAASLQAALHALETHQAPAQFPQHFIASYLTNLDSKRSANQLIPYPVTH